MDRAGGPDDEDVRVLRDRTVSRMFFRYAVAAGRRSGRKDMPVRAFFAVRKFGRRIPVPERVRWRKAGRSSGQSFLEWTGRNVVRRKTLSAGRAVAFGKPRAAVDGRGFSRFRFPGLFVLYPFPCGSSENGVEKSYAVCRIRNGVFFSSGFALWASPPFGPRKSFRNIGQMRDD